MAGLSFLVSPETQQQQAEVGASFQHGLNLVYSAQKQKEQLAAQEQMKQEEIQAAESRAEAATQRAYALNAMTTKRDMDLRQQMTDQQGTNADIKGVQAMWAANRKRIADDNNTYQKLAFQSGDKDQMDSASAYSANLNSAFAKTEDVINKYATDRRNQKPDQFIAPPSVEDLPAFNLHYSLDNPYRRAQYEATVANIQARTGQANAHAAHYLKQNEQMHPEAAGALKRYYDSHAAWQGAQAEYLAAKQAGVGGAALQELQQNVVKYKAQHDSQRVAALRMGAQGHYGPDVQATVQGMEKDWGEESDGGGVQIAPQQDASQGTPQVAPQQSLGGMSFGMPQYNN